MDAIDFDVDRFFNEIVESDELETFTGDHLPSERPELIFENANYNTTFGSFLENSPVSSQGHESPSSAGYDDLTNFYPTQQYEIKKEEQSPVSPSTTSPQSFSSCSSNINSPYQLNQDVIADELVVKDESMDIQYSQSPGSFNSVPNAEVASVDIREDNIQPVVKSPPIPQQDQQPREIPESLLQQKDFQQLLLKLLKDQVYKEQNKLQAIAVQDQLQRTVQSHQKITPVKALPKENVQKKTAATEPSVSLTKCLKVAKKNEKAKVKIKQKSNSASSIPQPQVIVPVVFSSTNGTSEVQSALTAVLSKSDSNTQPIMATTIPFKIVSSTRLETIENKVPIKPLKSLLMNYNGNKFEKPGKRSTNHNVVEMKYRRSINDNLRDLKELVFGPDTKSTKAGILRKAIDHIKYLRKINNRLKQENMQLKMGQKQTSLRDLVKGQDTNNTSIEIQQDYIESYTDEEEEEEGEMSDDAVNEISEPLTPDQTDSSCPSPSGSDQSIESVPSSSTFSMMDKTRFFLSVFMFAFMFCGPLKYLFAPQKLDSSSSSFVHPRAGGRTLLSVDQMENPSKTYSSWIVHFMLYVLFFMWMLIKGEPRYPTHSKQQKLYWTYLDKAHREIKEGDFTTGFSSLERCLYIIGRPLSTSRIDLFPAFLWHSICHVLNQFGILPLLKYLAWIILPRRLSSSKAMFRYQSSCELAARVYAKMHEIVLLDPSKRTNSMLAATLHMSAINMAENAKGRVEVDLRCRIYVNAALYLYQRFGILAKPFMRYFIRRALSTVQQSADEIPASVAWIFHPSGYQFLLSGKWSLSVNAEDMEENVQGGPFELVSCQFRTLQVKKVLTQALAPGSSKYTAQIGGVLKQLERSLSSFRLCFHQTDGLASWWHGTISSAIYIHFGFKDRFVNAWKKVGKIKQKDHPKSTLGQILYSTLECLYDLQNKDAESTIGDVEEQIMDNEDTLQEYFVFEKDKIKGKDGQEVSELMTALCADLMLQGRLQLWGKCDSQSLSEMQLTRFEQDLDILEKFSSVYPQLESKIEHYYQLLRLMSGSNPIDITNQVIRNCPSDSRNGMTEKLKPEQLDTFQESKTLLYTCKHALTAAIYYNDFANCESKLRQVGMALESAGLKDMRDECKILLTAFTK